MLTLSAMLNDDTIRINGVVTKLDQSNALRTKTLTEVASGKIVGIVQERIEIISELEFRASTNGN